MEIRIIFIITLAIIAMAVTLTETAITKQMKNKRLQPAQSISQRKTQQPSKQKQVPQTSKPKIPQQNQRQPQSKPHGGPTRIEGPGYGQRQTQYPYYNNRQYPPVVTSRPKFETTTNDRALINAPFRTMCPAGQRMDPDRNCITVFRDPETER
ncbi:uncharacterized protein LOC126900511 [Daktulosphaira vitifoliae]|uniref:uncharacterized protein LOC126900511 n=1 Tax=Daktulosphaira vitifoliae TaxID=58002 RepID=UPI0021AA028D|nr:uncharacterized protein LOC126900511 [Daktulosphaira vitifoliae]XP_050532237.1 uncharacterized protein LOC126900511 [Daktulosphaira vitifoliae]XP_050532238.1 uncharacterized protein LOC126900511 [Daktulosphaira vitifoliae]